MLAIKLKRIGQAMHYAAPGQTHPDVNAALALWLRAQLANTGLASAHHSNLPLVGGRSRDGMMLRELYDNIQQGHSGDFMPYSDLAQDSGLFQNHGELIRDLDRIGHLTEQYGARSGASPESPFVTTYATPGGDAVGDPAARVRIGLHAHHRGMLPMTTRLINMLHAQQPAVGASIDHLGAEAMTGHLGRLLALHNALMPIRHGAAFPLGSAAGDALSEIGAPIFANLNTRERFYPQGRRDLGIAP